MSQAIRSWASVIVDKPIGEVWAFVSDVRNMDRWVRGASDTQAPSGGAMGAGSAFTGKYTYRGRTFDVNYRISDYEPESRFGTESTEGPFQYSGVVTLESADGATRVTNTLEAGSDGAATSLMFKLMGPLLRWGMRRQIAKELGAMKRVIERGE